MINSSTTMQANNGFGEAIPMEADTNKAISLSRGMGM